jgi:tetratricopeptide (TPR) repeat protein
VIALAAGVNGPADPVLDQLVECHLVTESGRDRLGRQRFDCQELLLALARERLTGEDAPPEQAAALRSVFAGYAAAAALAARANGEDLRHIDPADLAAEVPTEVAQYAAREPIRWYRAERDGLTAAVSAAAKAAADGVVERSWVWRLAFALVPLAQAACDWNARAEALGLAMTAAEEAGDRMAVIVARTAAGELAADQSDWPTGQRHLDEAIRQAGGEPGASTALAAMLLGVIHRDAGRPVLAIRLLSRALVEFRASGDVVGQLRALRGLALAQYDIGDGQRALCTLAEFRRLAEPLGYPWTAMVGTDLAKVYRGLGRLEPALAEVTAALPEFVAREDPAWQGATLCELGEVLRALGRPDEALSRLRDAREIFVRVRDQHWLGHLDGAIGDTYVALGHPGKALDRYRAAQQLLALFDDQRSLKRVTAAIEAIAHRP